MNNYQNGNNFSGNNVNQQGANQQGANQQGTNQQGANQQVPNQQIPHQQFPDQPGTPVAPRKSGGDKKTIIVCVSIVLIVAIIAAAVVVGIFLLKGKKDDKGSEAVQAIETEETFEETDYTAGVPDLHTMLVTVPDKSGSLTDMIMLCVFDHVNKEISLVSIPRDTKVGNKKINSVAVSGGSTNIYKLISEVENLTGIPIDSYMHTKIECVSQTVDMFGGVYFNVPQRMVYSDPAQGLYINLSAGYQHINGDEAEQLLRYRGYATGDTYRSAVQRDFMMEAFEQCANSGNLDLIADWFEMSDKYTETDIDETELDAIAKIIVDGDYSIKDYSMPHTYSGDYVICNSSDMAALAEDLGF